MVFTTAIVMTVQVVYRNGLSEPLDLDNVIIHFQITSESLEFNYHQLQYYRVSKLQHILTPSSRSAFSIPQLTSTPLVSPKCITSS